MLFDCSNKMDKKVLADFYRIYKERKKPCFCCFVPVDLQLNIKYQNSIDSSFLDELI